MSTPLFSKQMSVVIDGSTLGCATDFSLKVDKDLIEIACLSSTGAKQSIPDLYGWSTTFSGLMMRSVGLDSGVTSYKVLLDKLIGSDASVSIYILPNVSTNSYYTGWGYIKSMTMDGGVGKAVTFAGEITGSSALTAATTA